MQEFKLDFEGPIIVWNKRNRVTVFGKLCGHALFAYRHAKSPAPFAYIDTFDMLVARKLDDVEGTQVILQVGSICDVVLFHQCSA